MSVGRRYADSCAAGNTNPVALRVASPSVTVAPSISAGTPIVASTRSNGTEPAFKNAAPNRARCSTMLIAVLSTSSHAKIGIGRGGPGGGGSEDEVSDIAGTVREAAGNATLGIRCNTLTEINTPPATALPCSMSSTHEHKPGDPAPETGHHEELNVFGSHTGKTVHARRANRYRVHPVASRGVGSFGEEG